MWPYRVRRTALGCRCQHRCRRCWREHTHDACCHLKQQGVVELLSKRKPTLTLDEPRLQAYLQVIQESPSIELHATYDAEQDLATLWDCLLAEASRRFADVYCRDRIPLSLYGLQVLGLHTADNAVSVLKEERDLYRHWFRTRRAGSDMMRLEVRLILVSTTLDGVQVYRHNSCSSLLLKWKQRMFKDAKSQEVEQRMKRLNVSS